MTTNAVTGPYIIGATLQAKRESVAQMVAGANPIVAVDVASSAVRVAVRALAEIE